MGFLCFLIKPNVSIFFCIFVTRRTMCFSGIYFINTTSIVIFTVTYRLKMIWVYARPNPAQVIYNQTFWNFPLKFFK